MSNYILKYEDALKICQKYNNNNFWEYQFMKHGYKVAAFNYFICGWNDFADPLPGENINAFDMRGATFVFNKDGSLWKTFLMLPKFFNINQVESTQYGIIKDKEISSISIKEDGSLVAFMMLPDGRLFSKTIGSFVSEQAENAYLILYRNEEHVIWVKKLLEKGFTPLFEYVSFDNRIVLKYSQPQIRFIGVRDNNFGAYIPASEMSIEIPSTIDVVKSKQGTLEEILEEAQTIENQEGWVFLFKDGQLMKVKTQGYFKLHGLRTQDVFREDYIIHNYLKETLDDLLSMLNPVDDKDAFDFVNTVVEATNNYIKFVDESVDKLYKLFTDENSYYYKNWAKFATDKHKDAFFGLTRTKIEYPEEYKRRQVEYILKLTLHLKGAKNLVEKWKKKG